MKPSRGRWCRSHARFQPMVRGLFSRAEQDVVRATLEKSVVCRAPSIGVSWGGDARLTKGRRAAAARARGQGRHGATRPKAGGSCSLATTPSSPGSVLSPMMLSPPARCTRRTTAVIWTTSRSVVASLLRSRRAGGARSLDNAGSRGDEPPRPARHEDRRAGGGGARRCRRAKGRPPYRHPGAQVTLDPFDRMLSSQALAGGLTLVTLDESISRHPLETL